jgi:steroid 5-alpha reductase family enzyme
MKKPKTTIVSFFFLVAAIFVAMLAIFPARQGNPLLTVLSITACTALASFFFGWATGDYSWTDRLWSTVPVGYGWIYAYASRFSAPSTLAAAMVTLWGIRLTANFARKGGYSDKEDYRWPILRQRISGRFAWQAFNFLFIACYQQLLFVCFTLPLWALSVAPAPASGTASWACVAAMLLFLVLETAADLQQFDFQMAKHGHRERKPEIKAEYEQGFLSSGLFSRSRHPNYLGELGFWWSVYAYAVAAHIPSAVVALAGPVLLTLLFVGSTIFTEQITASKYPLYEQHKRHSWPILFRPW